MKIKIWDEKYRQWDTGPLMVYPGEDIKKQGRVIIRFTGYKDQNGKEIYEGDIVQSEHRKSLVRWSHSGGCWELAPLDKDYCPGFDIDDTEEDYVACNGFDEASLAYNGGLDYNGPIKIIGNIFENPELLLITESDEDEDEDEDEELALEECEQCGETAWDGYICHSCGAKNI